MTATHVAIIGAGVIGLATAYELQRKGCSVTLIDPREPGTGASNGNTGWIVPVLSAPIPAPGLPLQVARWMLGRDSPFRVDLQSVPTTASWLIRFWRHCNAGDYHDGLRALGRLNVRSYDAFERWRCEGLEFEFDRPGVLFVAELPEYIEHLLTDVAELRDAGFGDVEWIDQSRIPEIEPILGGGTRAGVLAPDEQVVRPESLLSSLHRSVSQKGGVFVRRAIESAMPRDTGGGYYLSIGDGSIEADHVVIAAGAWTGQIGRMFGLNLPVIGGKGYSITVEEPALRLARPLYLADGKIACTPFDGANRFAGMMELTGLDDHIDPDRIQTMSRILDRYLPGWSLGSRREAWTVLRPMTPDGLPLLGKASGTRNVYVASGHGMLGVTLAPVTGEAIADLITHGETNADLGPFDPGRF